MGGKALTLATGMALACLLPIQAQQTNATSKSAEATNRVNGYAAWDDDFLYLAVQVNKPTVSGQNKEPFSNPLDDDAVILSIQTDGDHKTTGRTASTYTFAVSGAGGFQLYSGTEGTVLFKNLQEVFDKQSEIIKVEKDPKKQQEKLLAVQGSIIKSKVTQGGAERAGGGNAPGYTAEVAIPWADLGGKPSAGIRMGFNLSAQSKSLGSPPFQSFSGRVKTALDLANPSLFGEMLFSNASSPSAGTIVVCPRVFNRKPAIDGAIQPDEWSSLSKYSFGETVGAVIPNSVRETAFAARVRPELLPKPARPTLPIPTSNNEAFPVPVRDPAKIQPTLFAKYETAYQGDSRKAAPEQGVFRADLASLLAHHPIDGSGPWFSYDRADWHRKQLSEMRQEGIEVVLPNYRFGAADRGASDKSLLNMTEALRTLKERGEQYPQVALYLDLDSLSQDAGERLDLRINRKHRASLISAVREFYLRVPAEFRYLVAPAPEKGLKSSCVVFLSNASSLSDFDGSLSNDLRGAFLKEFGCDLIVLGGNGFKAKAGLDGYFGSIPEGGAQFNGDGAIKISTLNPGYDSVFVEGARPLARHSEDIYRDAWKSTLQKRPDFVLLESWNDFTSGSEIAPSLETGFTLADLTKLFARAYSGSAKLGVKHLGNNLPAVFKSGAAYRVSLRIQNDGTEGWGAGLNPVSFLYRWRKDGQTLGEGKPVAVNAILTPGQGVTLNLTIAANDSAGRPLPPGDYQLEATPVAKWAKELEAASSALRLPIRVQEALTAWNPTVAANDLPVLLESGSRSEIAATIRNDGSTTWKRGEGAYVALRLTKRVPNPESPSERIETYVKTSDSSVEIPQDVAPGQEISVKIPLSLIDEEGKPLPVWKQGDAWSYAIRWEVSAGKSGQVGSGARLTATQGGGLADGLLEGGLSLPQPVALCDFDFGVRFTDNKTPASLPADRAQPISLSLLNSSSQTWKKDQVRVGYHWLYLDGTEARWEDSLAPLPQDVPPGGKVSSMLVPISAPPTEGTYYLVWDLKFGDVWSSTTESSRTFDTQVNKVQVVGKRMIFADLSASYNLDGTSDIDDASGGFDGKGSAFPAAMIPPYADAQVTPSALWIPSAQTGPESPHQINFRFGKKDGKALNFIACKAQRVELGASSGQCRLLHIVAASTGKTDTRSLRLIFQEPTSQSEDQYNLAVSRWDETATHGEETALLCSKHYEKGVLKPGAVALYHYVIKIREPRKLVAITLPFDPDLKIAAITLEK